MNKYNGSAQRTAIVIGGSLGGVVRGEPPMPGSGFGQHQQLGY